MKQPAASSSGALAPIEYEPELIEESVRWTIEHGAPGIASLKLHRLRIDFGRQLDAIYGLPSREQREPAFREYFEALLDELDLASWIPSWLEIFPRLRTDLECVYVRTATTTGEQGAELWESREQRGEGVPSYLIITIAPPGLRHPEELRARLLPELLRAADLLDPDFDFRREDLACGTRAQRQQLSVAYRQLWEISASARLQELGLLDNTQLLAELRALFDGGLQKDDEAVRLLATLASEASHQQLLGLAERLRCNARLGADGTSERCPLCRYPTVDWAPDELVSALEAAIQGEFPGWSPREGCCGHCAELYELLATA